MIEVYQTIWAENRYAILARDKQKYEECFELVKDEQFVEAYPIMKEVMESDEFDIDDFDYYKEAAQEVWNHFKNKERDNSHFFATLNNQNENLRLLWNLNIFYQPVYLLNSRLFFKTTTWNRAWVIKNNKIRLFQWTGGTYNRLKLTDEMTEKIRHEHSLDAYTDDEKKLLRQAVTIVNVDHKEHFNPKLIFAIENGLEIE